MDLHHYPYPSQRMPLLATNGVVATSQPLAAQAGLSMLQRGGNAVDAAIATAAALTVVEPTSNGIGSDAFALVWDGATLHGLNGSGRAPQALNADSLREQGLTAMPEYGWLSVTVPGAVAAWEDLQDRFGRLSLAETLAPAIRYAEEGYPLSPVLADFWAAAKRTYDRHAMIEFLEWFKLFAHPGRTPAAGQIWRSPDHAATLRAIAEQGARALYEGEIAEKIVDFSKKFAALLTLDDLAQHRSQWVDPISHPYRDHEVWEIPPNGQGLTALIALAIIQGTRVPKLPFHAEESLHLQIEAMKLAFADAEAFIADPDVVDVPTQQLLAPKYIEQRRKQITARAGRPLSGTPPKGGTVYLCTADRDGMMVSFIQSNYEGFGSGIVIPQTGIALQNRAACFSLKEGHPNEAAGGKRPYHTIIPSFLTKGGQPVGPFGVMGGFMQPQGHAQLVVGTVDHNLNPQAVLDAPRWQVTGELGLNLEQGFPEHIIQSLAARGHDITIPVSRGPFGRGQIIWRLDEGVFVAGSDKRTDGCAVGW